MYIYATTAVIQQASGMMTEARYITNILKTGKQNQSIQFLKALKVNTELSKDHNVEAQTDWIGYPREGSV